MTCKAYDVVRSTVYSDNIGIVFTKESIQEEVSTTDVRILWLTPSQGGTAMQELSLSHIENTYEVLGNLGASFNALEAKLSE